LQRPQVRPAQCEVFGEIAGARNESASPKAWPPPLVRFTPAGVDADEERTHLGEEFLLLPVRDW
jgi:hypothetical protein